MAKTKFLGEQQWTNLQTGETLSAQVVAKEPGDIGFHKIWLHEILSLVEEVGNAKMQALMWLLENMDSSNRVIATHAQIAAASGVSTKSVARLMAALVSANVIAPVTKSIWRLNPAVIYKGDHNRRMAVLIKYGEESRQAELFADPKPEDLPENVHPIRAA